MLASQEELVPVSPSGLRFVHRGVGRLDQRIRIDTTIGIEGNSDAGADAYLVVVDHYGRTQCVEDVLCHRPRARFIANIIEDNGKLVAAEPSDEVNSPDAPP